jgi:hypothetical protein
MYCAEWKTGDVEVEDGQGTDFGTAGVSNQVFIDQDIGSCRSIHGLFNFGAQV